MEIRIRDIAGAFNKKLDKFLPELLDQSGCDCYVGLWVTKTNWLIELSISKKWHDPKPDSKSSAHKREIWHKPFQLLITISCTHLYTVRMGWFKCCQYFPLLSGH